MSDIASAWSAALPEVRRGVTGVGVWAALNSARPVSLEGDAFVLGVPHESSELSGHLRMVGTKMLIEREMAARLGRTIQLRVIEGTSSDDWERVKRKEAEARRLQDAALARARAEIQARSSWETVYEQLSRAYASIPNRSMPQSRARYYRDAIEIVAKATKIHPVADDLSERNYARCLERIAQYSEVPSVLVALAVEDKISSLG